MKKTYLCAVASLLLVAVSCSDDDTGTAFPTVIPDTSEEVALNPDEVSGNIIINNGTLVPGDAPTPTGSLPFSLNETTQSGFQKNGFNIIFDAPSNYDGAYIQVQSTDGTMADNYWNVSSTNRSNTKTSKKRKRISSRQISKLNDQQIEIDVDFEDAVTAGTFCYAICIYDTDGNISQPIEVCVEVEAWGGNPNLVGTWNYTKQIVNGETIPLGEINFCEGPESITCSNGETLTVLEEEGWCYASTKITLDLKADGTFVFTDLSFQKRNFNFQESIASCTPISDPVVDNFGSEDTLEGFWAYDEEENKLNLIVFSEEYIYFEDDYTESYEEEFGYLSDFSGEILINTTEIIINENNSSNQIITTHYSK